MQGGAAGAGDGETPLGSTESEIYPNFFKRHIQRKEAFKVFIGPVPSHEWVEIFGGFSAEIALRGNCRGEVITRELAGSERTAHAQRQSCQATDAGKTGVTTVRCNNSQEGIGAARCLTKEERKSVLPSWRVGLWQRDLKCEEKGGDVI